MIPAPHRTLENAGIGRACHHVCQMSQEEDTIRQEISLCNLGPSYVFSHGQVNFPGPYDIPWGDRTPEASDPTGRHEAFCFLFFFWGGSAMKAWR